MRRLFVVLMVCGWVSGATAQSVTRDWRPEDRTVVGDCSRVNAIATSSERVFIVSPSGVLIGNPQFVAEGPGFWVAGDRGVGFVRLGMPAVQLLRQGDLPGAVNDLAVDQEFLWVATDGGLVRFRLNAIRP